MIPKTFAIDFVRAVIDYKLSKNDNVEYFDNDNHNGIANFSFFEHLASDGAVDRYVRKFQELTEQQNRTHLAGFGILAVSNSPTITNLYDAFISPFEFTYTIRCKLADRDKMLGTLYHLIDELKGRKIDIAQLDTGVLFPVGTITDTLKSGDFIGVLVDATSIQVQAKINSITSLNIVNTLVDGDYVFAEIDGKLTKWNYENGSFYQDTTYFTNELAHKSFEKYKISLALNDISTNQPFTLNAVEQITFQLGGSATLVNNKVRLGNDLVRVYIKKDKIVVSDNDANNIYFDDLASAVNKTNDYIELEPLELPSNANANTVANQLRSNFFVPNSHTDSVAHTLQYSFVCDLENSLIKGWFDYARYHECKLSSINKSIVFESVTPNIIYKIKEQWSSWGNIEFHEILGKLNDDVDIENTEADILTLNLSFQLQGENN